MRYGRGLDNQMPEYAPAIVSRKFPIDFFLLVRMSSHQAPSGRGPTHHFSRQNSQQGTSSGLQAPAPPSIRLSRSASEAFQYTSAQSPSASTPALNAPFGLESAGSALSLPPSFAASHSIPPAQDLQDAGPTNRKSTDIPPPEPETPYVDVSITVVDF